MKKEPKLIKLQDEAVAAQDLMKKLNLKVPAVIELLAKLDQVVKLLESGYSNTDVCRIAELSFKSSILSSVWRKATGVSIKDVVKAPKIRKTLKSLGLNSEQIEEVLKLNQAETSKTSEATEAS